VFLGLKRNTKKCFSHLGSHAIDHKRWRLASWGHGDEATAMAARAAYKLASPWETRQRNGLPHLCSRIGQSRYPM